tara:strand:+ start:1626 stop:2579 length:954 start_codon:yes stop_codon:yes gene_type:complete
MELDIIRWIDISELHEKGYSSEISQVPTPFVHEHKLYLFVSGREKNNHSFVSLLIINEEWEIVDIHERVFTESNKPGTFDDEGVMPSYVMKIDDQYYMFYSGWNSRNTIPYHNATGICTSKNLLQWKRLYDGPILDRCAKEPYLAVTPCVQKNGHNFQMLYISGLGYTKINGKQEPIYTIKYAQSDKLEEWRREENPVIMLEDDNGNPLCFSHPSFYQLDNEKWIIVASLRGVSDYRDGINSYQLVYGMTNSLLKLDKVKPITFSSNNYTKTYRHRFDLMRAYPSLFYWQSRLFCSFNGNGFGRTGLGICHVRLNSI